MKHFSNKQFLAAIVTLTLTGAAMAQDGSDQTVADAKVIQSASEGVTGAKADARPASKPDGSDQRLTQDQRTQQVQGFPGQDGPIPSKPDGSDERSWDAKVAAQARDATDARSSERADGSDQRLTPDQRTQQIQGYPGQDGPIPAKSDGSDQLLSDADRVRLEAETTDRGVQFELSGSGANGDEKCGVILISLTPDLQQHVSDFPRLLWDSAVLGFGDMAPTLSLAIPSDYLFPDQFYAQGVVISSSGSVKATKVQHIRSR